MMVTDNTDSAPIALFVYNRLEHTRRTVDALVANIGADRSVLYVFSDAARSDSDIDSVNAVRDYVRRIDGFQKIFIVEQETNFGLAKSIIEGVTHLCEKYGRVIALEDDLETSPYFLSYMNAALKFYENAEEVMHISGCAYPIDRFGENDTYFLRVPLCWGWATWRRSWSSFKKDISIMNRFDDAMVRLFNFDGTYPYWKQLELNRSEKINTWFVFWYATVFLKGGLSLFPSRSLVKNIGFDSSGVHCASTTDYDVTVSTIPVKIEVIPIVESQEGIEKHKQYFRTVNRGFMSRFIRKIHRIFV